MTCEVEGTNDFADWFGGLTDDEQVAVGRVVELLAEHGPALPYPYSSGVTKSRHRHMRELRTAILLLGGDKTGDQRWYEVNVPRADALYDEHVRTLQEEGLI